MKPESVQFWLSSPAFICKKKTAEEICFYLLTSKSSDKSCIFISITCIWQQHNFAHFQLSCFFSFERPLILEHILAYIWNPDVYQLSRLHEGKRKRKKSKARSGNLTLYVHVCGLLWIKADIFQSHSLFSHTHTHTHTHTPSPSKTFRKL